MAVIHHVVAGSGSPPIVFVHGFGCSNTDWLGQIEHFSPHHLTVAVDLPGHGLTPAAAEESSIVLGSRAVNSLLQARAMPPAILVGHSMGCRVVLDVARLAPERVKAVVLVDGSRFPAGSNQVFETRFTAGEYAALVRGMFGQMFTAASDKRTVDAALQRALAVPEDVGKAYLLSMVRYDEAMLGSVLARLDKPLLVLQSTFINEKRKRTSMAAGQTTSYLEFIRATAPAARIEILPGVGHFPQLELPAETNAILASFIAAHS